MAYTDQVAALNRTQLESVLKLAEVASDSFDRLAEIQGKAVRSAYGDAVTSLRRMASIKDVGELASMSNALAQPAWDKAADYAKGMYETLASAQSQLAGTVEQQFAEIGKTLALGFDSALKSAPAGSEVAVAGLKSALQATNAMVESMAKAARQMSAVAGANAAAFAADTHSPRKKAA